MFRLHRRAAHPGQSIFAPRQRHGFVTSLSARLRCILTTVLCGGLASVCCRLAAIVHCRVATLRRRAIRRIALPGVDRDQLRQHDRRQHPGNPSSPDSSALHPDSVFPPDSALHLDPGFHLEPGFHPHSVFHRALSFSCRFFFSLHNQVQPRPPRGIFGRSLGDLSYHTTFSSPCQLQFGYSFQIKCISCRIAR